MKALPDLAIDAQVFQPPALGCVLCLPGLPGGSSKIYDLSPYGNHGTITGATWVKTSRGPRVLSFDGLDDLVSLGSHSSLTPGSNLHVHTWLKADATGSGYGRIITKADYNLWSWIIDISDTHKVRAVAMESNSGGVATAISIISIRDNSWHCIDAVFRDGISLKLCIDARNHRLYNRTAKAIGQVCTPDFRDNGIQGS